MAEEIEVIGTKCGKIFILSNDYLSLICDICGDDFIVLEDFRAHLNGHFPQLHNIKQENPISYNSDCESIPPEIHDDVKVTFADILQDNAGLHPTAYETVLFNEISARNNREQTITNNQRKEKPPKETPELQSNENVATKSNRYPKRNRKVTDKLKSLLTHEINEKGAEITKSSNKLTNNEANSCSISKKKNLKCSFCCKTFRSVRDRTEHENMHNKKRPLQCRICEKTFAASANLRRHVENHTISDGSRIKSSEARTFGFECRFCSKIFKVSAKRNDHENTHTGKRPYKCQICSRTFASFSNLNGHSKLHTDDRRHKCKVCKIGFIRKFKLDIHTREFHLPDTDPRRWFPCSDCDNNFKTYSHLISHRRNAHRQNTISLTCDYCEEEFQDKVPLAKHMRIHLGRK